MECNFIPKKVLDVELNYSVTLERFYESFVWIT